MCAGISNSHVNEIYTYVAKNQRSRFFAGGGCISVSFIERNVRIPGVIIYAFAETRDLGFVSCSHSNGH